MADFLLTLLVIAMLAAIAWLIRDEVKHFNSDKSDKDLSE